MLQAYEIVGLCGVACGVVAYGRVQWQRDYAKSFGYSFLNLISGILIIVSLMHDWNLASFVSNATWVCFSLYGVIRCAKYAGRGEPSPLSGKKPVGIPADER